MSAKDLWLFRESVGLVIVKKAELGLRCDIAPTKIDNIDHAPGWTQ